jgi:hypothetical protein
MYDGNRVACHGCGNTWDIFDIAGFVTGKTDFPSKKAFVLETLGMPAQPKKTRKKTPAAKPAPLSREQASEVYTRSEIQKFGDFLKAGKFTDFWAYKNEKSEIELIEARFEADKKSVISIYYDGKRLKSKNYPVLMYNRDKLKTHDGAIIVAEGAKAADAASKIPGFLGVTWNGGGKKASKLDWSPLENREVYLWPDDDRKKRDGKYLPDHKQVGIATMFYVQSKLPDAKIIPPVEAARKIKASGADLVEVLEIMSPDEIREYIMSSEGMVLPTKKPLTVEELDKAPFTVLGLSDTGHGHIITAEDRLLPISMTSLTKTHLLNIADISYWETRFGDRGRIDWETAINQIIRVTNIVDFDTSTIRGRGAWVERDGRICYHDGQKTLGDPDPRKLYLRKQRKDIGLEDKPLDPETCQKISSVVNRMSFETPADAVRVLGWTALAPFAGALPWRPAGLVTGDHQTGKSAILEYVIQPLAAPLSMSGGGTTEAGVRQMIANDAAAVTLDETDDDTPMKKRNKQALLSLMRQSTSNDAPIIAKGTKNQTAMAFQMRSMFLFLAISPEIEFAADESRLFRANTVRPDASLWPGIRSDLMDLITEKNCRAFRARTWKMLKDVIRQAEHVSHIIQDETGQGHRFCLSEAMLLTAYWLCWHNMTAMTDEQILNAVRLHFEMVRIAGPRDETGEIVDRLLDELVLVDRPDRVQMTIREILIAAHTGKVETDENTPMGGALSFPDQFYLRNVAIRLGFATLKNGDLAIAHGHHEIEKISGHSRGYELQLQRHPGCVEKNRVIQMAGRTRTCVILRGILDFGEETTGNEPNTQY